MHHSWSGHYTLDPSEIEARFNEDEGLSYLGSIFEDTPEEDNDQLDRVRVIVEQLPSREADFVELYYFKKIKQTAIAHLFGVSQPTVCYRLARAADRIRFLLQAPQVDKEQMQIDLAAFLTDSLDVQIMCLMWTTTCQSEVAKMLGVSQGLVRHRFLRTLEKMRKHAVCSQYVAAFEYISSNLNILREVQRPSTNDRFVHSLC